MRDFAVTLKNADGPYFVIKADDFEVKHQTGKFRLPFNIEFTRNTGNGSEIVGYVTYKDVFEIADVTDGEYKKIDIEEWPDHDK
ncbi:MAG: hypothetical protein J6S95_01590 [Lachnospiraceae bacterium]|nr:hypothetical protein [Lachnospiraceae bacterium]